MSVLNNLQPSVVLTKNELLTIDRPIHIEFEYSSGVDVPVICEVQAWGYVKGVYTKIGTPLYANRMSSSTQAAPKFKLDFADICGRYLNNTFKKVMNVNGSDVTTWHTTTETDALVDQKNGITNKDAEGCTQVKFEAFAWCVNDLGFLERTDEIGVYYSSTYFIEPLRLTLPEDFINSSSNINLFDQNNDTFDGVCQVDTLANGGKSKFPTSCPRNLVREIHKEYGLPLGLIVYNQASSIDIDVSFKALITSSSTTVSYDTELKSHGTGNTFLTYLYSITSLAPKLSGVSSTSDINNEVSFHLDLTGNDNVDSLRFKWLDSVRPNARAIYWVNDYNCLDYYLFSGGSSVDYANTTKTYITNRDYKQRRDRSRSVLSGKSSEIITVFSEAINKEALIWLQGIGRSRQVFEYDRLSKSFIPILIEDFETTVLDTVNKENGVSIEIKYERNVISTR